MSAAQPRTGPLRLPLRASAAGALALLCAAAAWAAPATHTIAIDGTAFVPATLTVNRGDRVVWRNKDPFPHTATAADRTFDSKNIGAGKSWAWVARKRGELDYICTLHPTMRARLVVQ